MPERDVLGERFGFDLRFRNGDLELRANGDIQLTEGPESVRANIEREIITLPSEIFWRPRYGIGLPQFLNLSANAALLADIRNRIRQALEDRPQVKRVESVEVGLGTTSGQVDINVRYELDTGPERLRLSLPVEA